MKESRKQHLKRYLGMGLPWVVRAIPEMAERISLAEYKDIHQLLLAE